MDIEYITRDEMAQWASFNNAMNAANALNAGRAKMCTTSEGCDPVYEGYCLVFEYHQVAQNNKNEWIVEPV